MDRVSWDAYFMKIAEFAKERSTCLRRQVGAVIVKDNRILTTGYNGAPSNCAHCGESRVCLRSKLDIPSGERHELCYAVHAEQNAIAQAAYSGISVKDGSMYVTCQPCIICTKLIINSGIKKIIFNGNYPDDFSKELFKEAGVRAVRFINNEEKKTIEQWCNEKEIEMMDPDGFDRTDPLLFERKFTEEDFLKRIYLCTIKIKDQSPFDNIDKNIFKSEEEHR